MPKLKPCSQCGSEEFENVEVGFSQLKKTCSKCGAITVVNRIKKPLTKEEIGEINKYLDERGIKHG